MTTFLLYMEYAYEIWNATYLIYAACIVIITVTRNRRLRNLYNKAERTPKRILYPFLAVFCFYLFVTLVFIDFIGNLKEQSIALYNSKHSYRMTVGIVMLCFFVLEFSVESIFHNANFGQVVFFHCLWTIAWLRNEINDDEGGNGDDQNTPDDPSGNAKDLFDDIDDWLKTARQKPVH